MKGFKGKLKKSPLKKKNLPDSITKVREVDNTKKKR